jgi:hypothetical protein
MISMGTIQGSFQEGGHVGPSSGRKLVAMPTLTGRKAPAVNSPPATEQPSAGVAESRSSPARRLRQPSAASWA